MGKLKVVSSANMFAKKKSKFQDYFDIRHNHILTPNQRSLGKEKKMFNNRSKGKSNKNQNNNKKWSQPKIQIKKDKENYSPVQNKPQKSHQKASRFEHSINKQYDSPSKDHEDIDFIFKGASKKVKGGSAVESAIAKVNEHLKLNRLQEAIDILTTTLQSDPQNYDLVYLLGICYIFNASYDQAINIFDNLLRAKPLKNIYLLLSVCYKKTDELGQTEKILEQCIRKFPKYYEAYIYRGKLYLKLKQLKRALFDFEKAISIDPTKQIGLIGKGDCLRLMEKYDEARAVYTTAFNSKKASNSVSLLLRRAICSMELKRLDVALEDINRLLESDFQNSEALYFKGLIYNKLKQQNDAIICYEQAIKFNSNKRAVTRSIYEITKIKIENRDYYEALYTLERAQYLDIDQKVIKNFKIFTDGVTSMMKKNYNDGIKILTELNEDQEKPLSNFLKPLFYSSRSYGFMALGKFQNSKEDLDAMERQFSLDLPNIYNKFICEGILACNNQKYEHALTLFSKAGKALPYRIEPAFYKAVTLICFATKLIPKQLRDKKRQYLESAMKTIGKVEHPIENNPSLFMVRGLLYYALGDLQKALDDFDRCWSESTKPDPLVFYMTGLIFGEMGKYSQAVNEFKRAIENDKDHKLPQAYLARAKCMVLLREINSGFVDLQSYMSYRPSSPQIHIWAGHLLYSIGAYQDAAKAYSNISNINKNFEVLQFRANCYLTCKDVLNTITNLKAMLDIKYDNKTFFDYQMLQCLRECSDQNIMDYGKILKQMKETKSKTSNAESKFGNIFEQADYQFYKGLMYFYEQKYAQASKNFRRALQLSDKKYEQNNIQGQDSHLQDYHKLDFTNRIFNRFEIVYNIAVAQILFGQNLAKPLKLLKSLPESLPEGDIKNQMLLLINLLAKEMVDRASKKQQNRAVNPSDQQAQLFPFPSQNRLCSIFPEVVLPFSTPVRTRLFFCLPHVQKPDITPRFEDKILEQFSMDSIEIKPQAPWIRRSEQGIIFTDEVIKCDIELSESSSSEEHEQEISEEEQEEMDHQDHHDYEDQGDGSERGNYRNQEEDQPQVKMRPDQLKQFFKLDYKTQQKLAKLQSNKS